MPGAYGNQSDGPLRMLHQVSGEEQSRSHPTDARLHGMVCNQSMRAAGGEPQFFHGLLGDHPFVGVTKNHDARVRFGHFLHDGKPGRIGLPGDQPQVRFDITGIGHGYIIRRRA